jgi:hypothetical protein
MARHIPRPELDDVAGRIGDVHGPAAVVPVEAVLLRLVAVIAQAGYRRVVFGLGNVERVVDVDAAAAAGEAHERSPQPDASPLARHHPGGVAVAPAFDDREPEDLDVEALRRVEVVDLEDELADAGDRDSADVSKIPVSRGQAFAGPPRASTRVEPSREDVARV